MDPKISTVKLLAFFNILSYGLIVGTTLLATSNGPQRVAVVGWICAVFSVCVFAAPLSIMVTQFFLYLTNKIFINYINF